MKKAVILNLTYNFENDHWMELKKKRNKHQNKLYSFSFVKML